MSDPLEGPHADAEEAAQVAGRDEASGIGIAELHDRILRLQAELDNVLKRSRRELDDARRYAELDLLRDLLPVLDNVQRAVHAADRSDDLQGLRAGFRMTAQQIEKLLGQHGCLAIPTDGTPFDPTVHDAILQQSVPGVAAGTVIATVSPGFRLHDRVVRPAQVIVAKET